MTQKVETHTFQAEAQQLLDLMIHSLYSHKEIFLRELISNASDALDRLRFEALTQTDLMAEGEELEIRLDTDSQARTLTIHDNGIGMSREEVMANIGTIAKSGSRELMEKIRQAKQEGTVSELIGQFGVGFYSSFMVADRIVLLTRRAGEEGATRWESKGDGDYTLAEAERPGRGTSITLYLKPVDKDNGLEDFTEEWVLSQIVKRYSDFVSYPILLPVEREVEVETEAAAEDPAEDKEGEEKAEEKKEKAKVIEDKRLNSLKPIWSRPAAEVSVEDYAEFYKHISHDWTEPLDSIPVKAEGRIEYQALLFIPKTAPFDLFYGDRRPGLQLYVRRVRIMERCEQLLPGYLRFVKGVVESPDLPLNVSREILQNDRNLTQIQKGLTKKILDRLKELAESESDKYRTFWKELGRSLKEGVSSDFTNRDKLVELLRFQSSHDPEKLTSLKQYAERMKEEQEVIYFLTGESRAVVENSPHLEAFKEKGYEVLFLVEPVDELLVQSLTEFDDKKLQSVGKGTVELGSKEEREQAEKEMSKQEETLRPLLDRLQKILDEEVKQVRLSTRLTSSPACLVGGEHDYSPQLERLLQQDKGGPKQRRILELNPEHEIVHRLRERFDPEAADDAVLEEYAELLLGYAHLAEGSEIPDAVKFNQRLVALMARGV